MVVKQNIAKLFSRILKEWNESRRWNRKKIQQGAGPRVYYGQQQVWGPDVKVWGGLIKLQDLTKVFPNCPQSPNLLYLVSSGLPTDAPRMAKIAVKKGARLVINQNGVAYPTWCPMGWRRVNQSMAILLHQAHHVFYQSEFCKMAADKFLGRRKRGCEVLYNPVDTSFFIPPEKKHRSEELHLLLAGSHNKSYRVRTAIQTLSLLRLRGVRCRLTVAGRYGWAADEREALREAKEMAAGEQVSSKVNFQGPYLQTEAPALFQSADILLHTQYMDSCPRLVVEAMACGVPVVYSDSGGVPELVGAVAGQGVPAPLDWEQVHPPSPDGLADAVVAVSRQLESYSVAARERAVTTFGVDHWLNRHREVFATLCSRG